MTLLDDRSAEAARPRPLSPGPRGAPAFSPCAWRW